MILIRNSSFPINLIAFIISITGLILLQIYLSQKPNKYLGLILPSVFGIFALINIFGILLFTAVPDRGHHHMTRFAPLLSVIPVGLMFLIPVVVLLLIYRGCRKSLTSKNEMDKMNIQDLE